MDVSWGTIKSLAIFFGPILLPKAISTYRRLRASQRQPGIPIKPASPPIRRALFLLLTTSLLLLLSALLPPLSPPLSHFLPSFLAPSENIFSATSSRLHIPTDVLFTRVAGLRPSGALTPTDTILRAKFVSLESRLLYLRFGPVPLTECLFCDSDHPDSYLYYALPAILAPHLLNLALLGLATSRLLVSRHANRWRALATIAAGLLAACDVGIVATWDHKENARALKLGDIAPFFWRMRMARLMSLAILDLTLAALLYLSATNRLFARAPSAAERVAASTKALAAAKSKITAAGVVKNAAVRNRETSNRAEEYWTHEVRLMGEMMEDREVIEGVKDALENRLDVGGMTNDADKYSSMVFQGVVDTPCACGKSHHDHDHE